MTTPAALEFAAARFKQTACAPARATPAPDPADDEFPSTTRPNQPSYRRRTRTRWRKLSSEFGLSAKGFAHSAMRHLQRCSLQDAIDIGLGARCSALGARAFPIRCRLATAGYQGFAGCHELRRIAVWDTRRCRRTWPVNRLHNCPSCAVDLILRCDRPANGVICRQTHLEELDLWGVGELGTDGLRSRSATHLTHLRLMTLRNRVRSCWPDWRARVAMHLDMHTYDPTLPFLHAVGELQQLKSLNISGKGVTAVHLAMLQRSCCRA